MHAYLGEGSGDGAEEEHGEGHDGGHRGHQGGRQVVSLGGFFSSILRYANRVTDTEGESTPTPPRPSKNIIFLIPTLSIWGNKIIFV